MDLIAFFERFPDEQACIDHLIAVRWPEGFVCQHCGHHGGYYLQARRAFECEHCQRQQSIRSGTLFEKTLVPLREWFLAIHLLATSKKGISALALQRQLPKHQENTIRLMLKKLKGAMSQREALYQLAGVIELDEACMGGKPRGKGREALAEK